MFAARWVRRLPRRWARNGAIFGLIFGFAKRGGGSSFFLYLSEYPALIINLLEVVLYFTAFCTLLGSLLGLWVRWSLSPIDNCDWNVKVKAIPRKWTLGAILIGVIIDLADLLFQWRGQEFATGWTAEAIVENIGIVIGGIAASVTVGVVTGYISRRGLKRAIADDQLRVEAGAVA
jgi:hypothetical protein